MGDKSNIQWTNATWNIVTGCTRVSEGCRHCYIERTPPFRMAGRKFVNGTTGVQLHPDRLVVPLHWKKPRRVFVNSLSDLFHEDIPTEFIFKVLTTIWQAKQHTFQVLTKRPLRMRLAMEAHYCSIQRGPLDNLWLGVSCEDQATADARIPLLLDTPAVIRFLSCEPLLEHIDLSKWLATGKISWVILGGESGPQARPTNIAWIRSLKDQCQAAGTKCFIKQLGAKPVEDGCEPGHVLVGRNPSSLHRLKDKKGGAIEEWPLDLQVREYPDPSRR